MAPKKLREPAMAEESKVKQYFTDHLLKDLENVEAMLEVNLFEKTSPDLELNRSSV